MISCIFRIHVPSLECRGERQVPLCLGNFAFELSIFNSTSPIYARNALPI
jgi:hypothetical protein